MLLRLCLLVFSVFCSVAYSWPGGSFASEQTVKMKEWGFYITSPFAKFTDSKTLFLAAPIIDWLDDIKASQPEGISEVDLSDIPTFASALDTGFTRAEVHYSMTLNYNDGQKWREIDIDERVKGVTSNGSDIKFIFKDDVEPELGQTMGKVTLTVKVEHDPYPYRDFMHTVCCDCSGKCALLWILCAYCSNCIQPRGGMDCCKLCDPPVPAAPGGKC